MGNPFCNKPLVLESLNIDMQKTMEHSQVGGMNNLSNDAIKPSEVNK
jgi:hypothetical protein